MIKDSEYTVEQLANHIGLLMEYGSTTQEDLALRLYKDSLGASLKNLNLEEHKEILEILTGINI